MRPLSCLRSSLRCCVLSSFNGKKTISTLRVSKAIRSTAPCSAPTWRSSFVDSRIPGGSSSPVRRHYSNHPDTPAAPMVQKAMSFTPQVLLSAPRRSAGIPNPSCTKVLYTTSTYSFETHKKTSELRLLDVDSGESHPLAQDEDVSDFNWLNDDEYVALLSEKDSTTSIYVCNASQMAVEQSLDKKKSYVYVVGTIDGPAGDLKVKQLDERGDQFAFVLSAESTGSDEGTIYNPEKMKPTHAAGRLYNGLYVRHWDRWETKEKKALWYGKLSKAWSRDGKFLLSGLTNSLAGTSLESPIRPFGGTDCFDLSKDRIVFVAKDPDLNPALNTKVNVYIINIDDWNGSKTHKMARIYLQGMDGASSSPVFTPDGKGIAFLSMAKNGYESDRNNMFIMYDVRTEDQMDVKPLTFKEKWDRSPSSILFSADGSKVLVTAEEIAVTKVFEIDPRDYLFGKTPRALTTTGSISDVRPLKGGHIFVSGSSLTDNSFFAIVDPLIPDTRNVPLTTWINSNSDSGGKFGLKSSQVSSIWTPASNYNINEEVHSIVFRPSNFDGSKKYPVAYLIHGGPQGAWGDSWSTRWNPAVFAEQGYIVIAPNPTGSTGYGQAFTDAIRNNWGGDPYQDIVNVFDWVSENMAEADNERAVLLGASYGGYMANWVQGHDLGRKLKAIVCHDGITSFASALATEELYFPFHEYGGTPWFDPGFEASNKSSSNSAAAQSNRNFGSTTLSSWQKWDPSAHFSSWSTPQLIIHSAKDYRLTITEGLAAFNVLQARGVPSQFLTFADENHWVLKPENSLLWHKVVLNFINKYVGLEAFAKEDYEGFYGGLKEDEEQAAAEMPAQGRPET